MTELLAALFLLTLLASLTGLAYVIWHWWYVIIWVALGLFIDYTLLTSAFRVWYHYIMIGGTA